MDLWNNEVGRKHGNVTNGRKELLKRIHSAVKGGELIIDPADTREFQGARNNPENMSRPVIVLSEGKNGRNELFFDVVKKVMLTRLEFVTRIQAGTYPSYSVKKIGRILVPVSNPDNRNTNNLG